MDACDIFTEGIEQLKECQFNRDKEIRSHVGALTSLNRIGALISNSASLGAALCKTDLWEPTRPARPISTQQLGRLLLQ